MKLSTTQRHLTEMVAIKKQRLADETQAERQMILAEIDRRTASARYEYEQAVLDAAEAGVPKAQIARAAGTTNPTPVREIIRRARIARASMLSNRYERVSEDELRVRLSGPALEAASAATGWTVAEAVSMGADTARFEVVHDSALASLTYSYVELVGRMHPVVFWVRRDPSEALAWWKEIVK